MSTILCTKTPGVSCVRQMGHSGVCTPCPSAATLDWDHDRETVQQRHIDTAVTLWMLDFETPPWADLLD